MSETPGPTPPEQPKQEVPPTEALSPSPAETALPPKTETTPTPDTSAETAALAELQTLRAQYDSILPKARAYIGWGPRLPGRASIARDKVAVFGRNGPTEESVIEEAKIQTLERAFKVTRDITGWVERGEQSIMQIDHVLAHPSEAQAMDVSSLIQSLSARIIALERFMDELQRYESIIGSPPTPEAPSTAPAAQPTETPKPSPEVSAHPEEMLQAQALREEFRQLSAEVQKYMVEMRHVDVRAAALGSPHGRVLTDEEALELRSARDLKGELELLTNRITGFYAERSAQEVDNFLNTGQMTELTGSSMVDLKYRIDKMTPQIQKFRAHWAKYPPRG